MILLLPEHRALLRANARAREDACRTRSPEPDPVPLVKLFLFFGAATWLATELDEDGIAGESRASPQLFGLADLGFRCPEPGSFSLREIASVRLPLGLTIERDLCFEGLRPLSVWAQAVRLTQSISSAERLIREIVANALPKLPPASGG